MSAKKNVDDGSFVSRDELVKTFSRRKRKKAVELKRCNRYARDPGEILRGGLITVLQNEV